MSRSRSENCLSSPANPSLGDAFPLLGPVSRLMPSVRRHLHEQTKGVLSSVVFLDQGNHVLLTIPQPSFDRSLLLLIIKSDNSHTVCSFTIPFVHAYSLKVLQRRLRPRRLIQATAAADVYSSVSAKWALTDKIIHHISNMAVFCTYAAVPFFILDPVRPLRWAHNPRSSASRR